jgi:hypothetical protein
MGQPRLSSVLFGEVDLHVARQRVEVRPVEMGQGQNREIEVDAVATWPELASRDAGTITTLGLRASPVTQVMPLDGFRACALQRIPE